MKAHVEIARQHLPEVNIPRICLIYKVNFASTCVIGAANLN